MPAPLDARVQATLLALCTGGEPQAVLPVPLCEPMLAANTLHGPWLRVVDCWDAVRPLAPMAGMGYVAGWVVPAGLAFEGVCCVQQTGQQYQAPVCFHRSVHDGLPEPLVDMHAGA
jgi:hypothetical protein